MRVSPSLYVAYLVLVIALPVAGGLLLAYGRLSAAALRQRRAHLEPRPLSREELSRLGAWARRDVTFFVADLGALLPIALLVAVGLPPDTVLVLYLALVGAAVASVAHHLRARCPVCGRRIGLQSSLGLPMACEICRAVFRPDVALGGVARRAAAFRFDSAARLLGLPLLSVAIGPAEGQARGVARGIVAVGDVAVGVVAVGGVAVGGLCVGGLTLGVVGVGGVSAGLCALGGLAVGGAAVGGVAIGGVALGGIAIGVSVHGGLPLRL